MKILLLVLAIAVVALALDDSSQRNSIAQLNSQIEQLTQDRDQARQELARFSSKPENQNWFQQRLQNHPSPLGTPGRF